jgi:hypothetical protein
MGYLWLPGLFALLQGVDPHEVLEVLGASRRRPLRIDDPTGPALLAVQARTSGGRPLVVVLRHGWPDSTIVGARELTPGELKGFTVWEEMWS